MKMQRNLIFAIIIASVGFLILIWFVLALIPNHLNLFYELSLNKASKIGDFVGGFIGALFTIAGFILLYETLNLQRIESSSTRAFLKVQQFENNFFQLMKSHNDIVNSMDISQELFDEKGQLISRNVFYSGKDCFGFWYLELEKTMQKESATLEILKNSFQEFYSRWELDLSIYYSQINQLLKFVEYSNIEQENIYLDIFKANLSINELVIMFYYTYLNENSEFVRLAEKYNIFENMIKRRLMNPEHFDLLRNKNV